MWTSDIKMYKCLLLLSITVIVNITPAASEHEHQGPQTCGGRLKGPVGVIQTPNFPDPFPVPIKCRWIIEHDIVNGTISIYFTQQYTTSGLTFTEYMYYDDTYKLGERRALTVTEENITRIKWLQVTSPVLVVELSLSRLEGTQLRALGLLAEFGFNVTYALRRPGAREPRSCSAVECRLLGHCYATLDHRDFFCSCFEGYSGADCGGGPLCPRTPDMCKNGGTCSQMGPAAVSCLCAPGYTGDLCEAPIAAPECGIEECGEGCRGGATCDCNPKDSDSSSARFETQLQVVDQDILNISQELATQVKIYLKNLKISIEDEVEILGVRASEASGASVYSVRVWAARRDASDVRAALAGLAAARSLARLRLAPSAPPVDMQPALNLHALIINQRPEVWEGSEFILSCIAYGSPDIVFTWYKDGIKINFNGTTRDIWTRLVAEDALGRRMAVLGVGAARAQDAGRWACGARAGRRARCRALRLFVRARPTASLRPAALTVHKGDNVSLTCLAGARRGLGALGFSWARERALLPLAPPHQVWEDLYPAGSLLRLYNLQKTGEYRCQVSSAAGTSTGTARVWVLEPGAAACAADEARGLLWPRTAPGALATAPCPRALRGLATRFCEPKTDQHGVKWSQPDFSGCVADSLKEIYEQFTLISLGYSRDGVWRVLRRYAAALRAQPALAGAGATPLRHCARVLAYLRSAAAAADRERSADYLLRIFDYLLKHPDSFMDEQNIYDLQNAVVTTGGIKDNIEMTLTQLSLSTKPIRDDRAAHFIFQPTFTETEEWIVTSAGIELLDRTGNATGVAVLYHNLAERLPSLRRSIQFKSGREIEYQLASKQIQLYASGVDPTLPHTVTSLFTYVKNYSSMASTFHSASKLACGVRTTLEPNTWNWESCSVRVPEPVTVACRCRGLGTVALFTIERSTLSDEESDVRGVAALALRVGGALCAAAAALQLLALVRAPTLDAALRAAAAAAHAAALVTLPHCAPRQATACPGVLGWLVAASWCAGSAALCAQPLLLQAELAGRPQRAAAVALLAGVWLLACLSARLAGGAPLHAGSAAGAALLAAGALLAALQALLAAAATRRLAALARKLPPERRGPLLARRRAARHSLLLALTAAAAQSAGLAHAQPGARRACAAAAAAAALTHGAALLLCYGWLEAGCARGGAARDLNLHIKHGGETENHSAAAMLAPCSPPAAPAGPPPAPHRRQIADSRADIVRCVERHPPALQLGGGVQLCDLISHTRAPPLAAQRPPAVCLQLSTLNDPRIPEPLSPLLTYSVHYDPELQLRFNPFKESCNICVQSNPDVSRIPFLPVKSCLKKPKLELTSSTSLPSIEVTKEEPKNKSDIEQVNREWNEAYNSPDTEKVLHKISHDLDFLLNRTMHTNSVYHIEEAPS